MKLKTGAILILSASVLSIVLMPDKSLTETQPAKEPELEYSNSLQPVEVKRGQGFSIVLGSNPTTGYRWQLAKKLDRTILKLVDSQYKAPQTQLIGAGGKEIWTFKALRRGKTEILLEYVRPWEKDAVAAKGETFKVFVR